MKFHFLADPRITRPQGWTAASLHHVITAETASDGAIRTENVFVCGTLLFAVCRGCFCRRHSDEYFTERFSRTEVVLSNFEKAANLLKMQRNESVYPRFTMEELLTVN
ncbi:hypothetical protein NDU88_005868 [Pleurodeles waltl]|uniref:Uncharacterized protein n=1 Tax=Pleurodeles waltl TaxID=8319 RepID=A0AAV7LVA0_PLEWA|nr:hypothetical protein NDU88_005868 [Pleurodeles waltl]